MFQKWKNTTKNIGNKWEINQNYGTENSETETQRNWIRKEKRRVEIDAQLEMSWVKTVVQGTIVQETSVNNSYPGLKWWHKRVVLYCNELGAINKQYNFMKQLCNANVLDAQLEMRGWLKCAFARV